jgi:hypothetical protein
VTRRSIIAHLDRVLKPLGYARSRITWNRGTDNFVAVLDLQTSRSRDAITLNVGVLSRTIFRHAWGRNEDAFILEPFCTVRARIGQLVGSKDVWWDLDAEDALSKVADSLSKHALPFISQMQTLPAMRDWLLAHGAPSPVRPLEAIYLALLQNELGDAESGCATLNGLAQNVSDAWSVRVTAAAASIGCPQ